jgi:hypothetical protein
MRLQEALALLSPEDREALRSRRRIVLDPRKKIDEIEQTARALIAETDLRHSRFPSEVRALLARLAGANGMLANAAHDPGAAMLCELGIAYQPRGGTASRSAARTGKRFAAGALVLPSAFQIQVPPGPGDDPRSLRVCLGFVENEIVPALVSTVVGRPLAVAGPLALQEVWEVLSSPGEIAQRVSQLPAAESRLLDAIERAGSEVTTEELLALDQTPGLYRTAAGIAVPKRGAPFMLQRRGFLFQIGVDRFVLPTEVSRVIGASRAAERAGRRAQVLAALAAEDHAPRRARYARDPSLGAGATLAMLRHAEATFREEAGAPRGVIRKIAERLGEREETVSLWVALMRAAGLGRVLLADAQTPGSLSSIATADLGGLLRSTYRRGGAWDETRVDAEVARTGYSERGTTAAPALRMIVLDALEELARDRWVPVDVVVKYALDDPRAPGAARIHERARRERPGVYRDGTEGALRAMLVESIPAIGLADLAEDGSTIRLSGRDTTHQGPPAVSTVARNSIEIPASIALSRLLALSDIAEPDHIRPDANLIVLTLGAPATARARSKNLEANAVLQRFQAVGIREPHPAAVEELVAGLGVAREISGVPLGAALLVEDPGLRGEILADAIVRRSVVDIEAGAMVFLRADADIAKITARLARFGVRLHMIEAPALGANEAESTHAAAASAPAAPARVEIRKRRSVAPDALAHTDEDGEVSTG